MDASSSDNASSWSPRALDAQPSSSSDNDDTLQPTSSSHFSHMHSHHHQLSATTTSSSDDPDDYAYAMSSTPHSGHSGGTTPSAPAGGGRHAPSNPYATRRRGTLQHQQQSHTPESSDYYTSAAPPYSPPITTNVDTLSSPLSPRPGVGGGPDAVNPYAVGDHSGARSRRKSVSTAVAAAALEEEETKYGGFGTGGIGSFQKKPKRRARASSFTYLPFHRRRRLSNASSGWGVWRYVAVLQNAIRRLLRRRLLVPAGLVLALLVLAVWALLRSYELQVEMSVFSHAWVRQEIDSLAPLKGCFAPGAVSPEYNMTLHRAGRKHMMSPGLSLRHGMTCYDFASTIQREPSAPLKPLLYHSYWRSDLMPFGERQAATLTAFLATQPLAHSKLILWSNGADTLAASPNIAPFLAEWAGHIEVRQVDLVGLTLGTELEGLLNAMHGGGLFDTRAWVDGDAIRLLVLWHYGGVWMDMDEVLTRDLHPLTESEFVTQWDCYDKPYFQLNGALMHFRRHSPYLCEAFHIMASSPLPKPNTFTWGSHLYTKLHRRLIASHVVPFAVLPWCFADPRNCRSDVRFPDPFRPDPTIWGGRRWDGRGEVGRSGREMLEEKVGYVWSIHLHNQWAKRFPSGGWIDRLLQGYRDEVVRLKTLGAGKNSAFPRLPHVPGAGAPVQPPARAPAQQHNEIVGVGGVDGAQQAVVGVNAPGGPAAPREKRDVAAPVAARVEVPVAHAGVGAAQAGAKEDKDRAEVGAAEATGKPVRVDRERDEVVDEEDEDE